MSGLDTVGATQYVQSIAYAAHGAPSATTLGNGLVESISYNNRLQPCTIAASSLLSLRFRYGATDDVNCDVTSNDNNGNVLSQSITRGASIGTQYYRYDGVNRLTIAAEGAQPSSDTACPPGAAWCRDYDYDAYGNRAVVGSAGPTLKMATPTDLTEFNAATNRISAGQYDPAGNLLSLANIGVMAYDADNKMVSYDNADQNNAGAGTYAYDGQGQRIQRTAVTSTGTETTTYVYDAFGKLAAEYSTKASTEPAALRLFRTSDHLGSTRLVTDATGQTRPNGCRDFLPFGERIDKDVGGRSDDCYGGTEAEDVFAQRFTGKERDGESGLDYFGARYFGSSLGRFTSPDAPFADQQVQDPQSWNLYAYTTNNPLTYVDPTGRAKTKIFASVIKKLQVGFRQITVRHDKPARSLSLPDARDRVQSGGEAVFEGRGGAQKATGQDAVFHDAHTATAGDDALPHLHPTVTKKNQRTGKSTTNKKSGHAFIRSASQRVVIPGATAGTALFGDNLLGATADFFNPVAEVQDVAEIMETSVIPTIFGFVDEYLLSPPSPPQDQSESSAQQTTEQQQACQQQQDCATRP